VIFDQEWRENMGFETIEDDLEHEGLQKGIINAPT
jgi:hypothetical protein